MDYQRAYAKIDLDAIAHNIALVKKKIADGTKLMLIIKADAYGHGATVIANEFEREADYFGVAEMNEALELRAAGIRKPILILGYTSPYLFDKALAHDITLTMFQYENIEALSASAQRLGKEAKIHFAVDTGMSRIGFGVSEEDAALAAKPAKLPFIRLEGIFSHFAMADAIDKTSAEKQRMLFERFLAMLGERGVQAPIRHLDNSAGILSFENGYEMVREGIILYGLYPSEEVCSQVRDFYDFRPAMEIVTHISHIKMLGAIIVTRYYSRFNFCSVATINIIFRRHHRRCLNGNSSDFVKSKHNKPKKIASF